MPRKPTDPDTASSENRQPPPSDEWAQKEPTPQPLRGLELLQGAAMPAGALFAAEPPPPAPSVLIEMHRVLPPHYLRFVSDFMPHDGVLPHAISLNPLAVPELLDNVLGIQEWGVDFRTGSEGRVYCELFVVPLGIGRTGWGGDEDEALSRAAMMWGLGRYIATITPCNPPCDEEGVTDYPLALPKAFLPEGATMHEDWTRAHRGFHASGVELYKEKWEEKRPGALARYSEKRNFRCTSSNQLWAWQLDEMANVMRETARNARRQAGDQS